jgi:hypothetical protein
MISTAVRMAEFKKKYLNAGNKNAFSQSRLLANLSIGPMEGM